MPPSVHDWFRDDLGNLYGPWRRWPNGDKVRDIILPSGHIIQEVR